MLGAGPPSADEIAKLYESLTPIKQRVASRVIKLFKQAPGRDKKAWIIDHLENDWRLASSAEEAEALQSTISFLQQYRYDDRGE